MVAIAGFSRGFLSRWLKKAPQPASLRYTTEDDEERTITIGSSPRRWKEAEAALLNVNAVRVEALSADGNVLRVEVLREVDSAEAPDKSSASKELHGMAAIFDAQGRAIERAYAAGADSASRGQDNLVQVVNILTAQWSASMQSLHNVSMNLAKLARQAGATPEESDDDGMSQQMQHLVGLAAMKMMGVQNNGSQAAPPKKDKEEE